MSNEQGVASSSGQHANDRQPDIGRALRWITTEADTQHVRQRLEQRPRVLFQPTRVLQ